MKAKELAAKLKSRGYKVTIKDVAVVLDCWEKALKGDENPWAAAHETKLYNKQGCAYCVLQELLLKD